MMIYPEVQRKAQEEIDRVVGNKRFPRVADRPNLPYMNALISEVLRWHPVSPLGLPHSPSQDQIFEGYRIPKDAILLTNIWYASVRSIKIKMKQSC